MQPSYRADVSSAMGLDMPLIHEESFRKFEDPPRHAANLSKNLLQIVQFDMCQC